MPLRRTTVLTIALSLTVGLALWVGNATTSQGAASPPAAPTGVRAAAGDGRILVRWSAQRGATQYRVIVDGALAGRTRTTSFLVPNLVNGRVYRLAVRAVNGAGASAAAGPVTAMPAQRSTASPARLSWFYKPPRDPSDEPAVFEAFDDYILTRGDERFVAQLRRLRPGTPVMQYFLLTQIIRPTEGGVEQRNNAAYMPGDFDMLWREHPDWFLRDVDGDPIIEGGKYYRMDPGNDEWRTFWIKRVIAANGRFNGVFADNLDLSLTALDRDGIEVARYRTDDAYTDALAGFVARIHREYAEPLGKPFAANLVNGTPSRDARAKYLPFIDGAMEEGWAVGWRDSFLSAERWSAELRRIDELARLKKAAYLVAQGDQDDDVRVRFAYASYLLVAGPGVSFRYTRTGSYGRPWLFDSYSVPLGAPLGPRYPQPDGSIRRDFAAGCVVVRPGTREASVVEGQCPSAGM